VGGLIWADTSPGDEGITQKRKVTQRRESDSKFLEKTLLPKKISRWGGIVRERSKFNTVGRHSNKAGKDDQHNGYHRKAQGQG